MRQASLHTREIWFGWEESGRATVGYADCALLVGGVGGHVVGLEWSAGTGGDCS